MQKVGARLREARVARGLSLDDVAQITKITRPVLVALEEGDTDALPALVFVRGFVRSYARLVELDPNPIVRDLERAARPGERGQAARDDRAIGDDLDDRARRRRTVPVRSIAESTARQRTDILALQMAPHVERGASGIRRGYAILLVVAAGLLIAAWLMVGAHRVPPSTAGNNGTTNPVVPTLHDHVDGVSSITDTQEADQSPIR